MSEVRGMNDPSRIGRQDGLGAMPRREAGAEGARLPRRHLHRSTTNGCATRDRRTCATTWRRRTATANSAWHRSHRCAKRCSRNSSRMCRKPTCPCRRAWTATGTSPAPSRGEQYAAQCRVPIRGADDSGSADGGGRCATRRRTGGVRYERRGARPRFLPHRRHGHFQGRPLDAVRHRHELATNATISASVILRPATSWRSGSKASAEPASRRTRNGCSMCCWTTRGVHTR